MSIGRNGYTVHWLLSHYSIPLSLSLILNLALTVYNNAFVPALQVAVLA